MHLMHRPSLLLLILISLSACSGPDPVARKPAKPDPVEVKTTEAPVNEPVVDDPAAPAPQKPQKFTVAVISDLNASYGATHYRDEVHAGVRWITDDLKPDLVICAGDMVAGQRRGLDYRAMWKSFHASITTKFEAAEIPFAITPGNHDGAKAKRYADERKELLAQWRDRKPEVAWVDQSHWPLYYAFEQEGVLFVSIDATLPGRIDDIQKEWLAETLAGREGPKVVFGHVPLYPFATGREREILDDPELESLLLENDVTMFITGHHHAYYPGRRNGLRLISAPLLGNGARSLVGSKVTPERGVLVIDFEDGEASYRVHAAPSFEKFIDPAGLPDVLNPRRDRHRMVRDAFAPKVAAR